MPVSGWLIVADRPSDVPDGLGTLPVRATRDYILRPPANGRQPVKVLNLSRDYGYQTLGYYASLLAEARRHKVLPSVASILELRRRNGYAYALGELEELLRRIMRRLTDPPGTSFRLLICFGMCDDARFARLARAVFDHFRCPILELVVRAGEAWHIRKLAPLAIDELDEPGRSLLAQGILAHVRVPWRQRRAKTPPRFDMAVLHDPKDALPPSDIGSLKHFSKIAAGMGVGVELITRRDLDRVAEFDCLWIRETTNIDHHTFQFAQRAEQEGMPVIDDPGSIMRCTNKVYLAELLTAHGVPTPHTVIISSLKELDELERRLSWPMVLKIPDGSFSRGVTKVGNRAELERSVRGMLEDSDLILAQQFVPTSFDWRVGVLDGKPLFATQYLMARKHWQIIQHRDGGKSIEGGFRTVRLADAPKAVIATAVKAAKLIGQGLYGVDLKETAEGIMVIEINDNPNITSDVEGAAEGDQMWRSLVQWFIDRLA